MAADQKMRGVGEQVLRFLDDHRLEHSPAFYAFAHRYLFGEDPAFRGQVAGIIDGGVRITPEQIGRFDRSEARAADAAPQLDAITLRVLDIIGDALDATGTLNRDLVKASASLLGPDAPSVRIVVSAMIERTARAESSLADATLQAQRLREELNVIRNDASHDPLTGLVNRAAMEEHVVAAAASPGGCCVAVVDIDRFGAINDAYGRGVGDRVLKAVAATLRETCLPHLVARWGGEEFVVLFEDTGGARAAAVMEQARATLSAKRLKLRETDEPLGAISVSAGVAASAGRSAAAVIEIAEGLLLAAKRGGRNMVAAEP